jgi:hypothetical protein
MIIRIFRARIISGSHSLWLDKVEKFSIPWLESQPGLIAYYPGKPLDEESREFSMTSIWDTKEALKNAVGDDWRQVVLLEDEAALVEETSVEHYEYFDASGNISNDEL